MILWRGGGSTGRYGGVAYVIKYKLLQNLEKAFNLEWVKQPTLLANRADE